MKESEKKLEKTLVKKVKDLGGWCIKLPAIHITGIPDRLCIFPKEKVLFFRIEINR